MTLSPDLYHSILKTAPVGFFILDRNLRFLEINQYLTEILGLSEEQHLGKNIAEVISKFPKNIIPILERVIARRTPVQNIEISGRHPTQNDQIGYWYCSFYPVSVGIAGIVNDVSELKNTKKRLERAESIAKIGNWEWNIATQEIVWSKELFRMYEKDVSESQPSSFWELLTFIHPEDRPNFRKIVEKAIAEGVGYKLEHRVVTKNGTIRHHYVEARVKHDKKGNIVGLYGITTDITERKIIENKLKRFNQELEREVTQKTKQLTYKSLRYRALMDHASDAIILSDVHSNIIEVNRQAIEMFEATETELIGIQISKCFPFEQINIVNQFTREIYQRQQARIDDLTVVTLTGKKIPVDISASLIEVQGEKVIQNIVRDITERKQIEEELRKATRLKDEFLATMSHELRSPLTAILGQTEIMVEQIYGSLNSSQTHSLEVIRQSANHLLFLINEILDLAKIEAGEMTLNPEPISIEYLCESSMIFVKERAIRKQINLTFKKPNYLADVIVDDRRMRQVLINLLTNAVKFTPEGGKITLEVSLKNKSADSDHSANLPYLRFMVKDTGIGIAKEDLGKLFQPFMQIDSNLNRQYEGTGLGLVIVKKIVEMHGGTISVKSKVNQGSCFLIEIPHRMPLNAQIETKISQQIHKEDINSQTNIPTKILLAEDNEANIVTFSGYLRAKGYQLIIAKNGEEAISLAKIEQPELILMDISMPKVDGLEAIKIIKEDPQLNQIPIIALTAFAMEGDRDKCLSAGANDYLSKPFKLTELARKIESLK